MALLTDARFNLTCNSNGTTALDDVSFKIQAGAKVGICGRTGRSVTMYEVFNPTLTS
jgi:ABC-type polysaccharide/polyol phosphate transport system ATPase subunit